MDVQMGMFKAHFWFMTYCNTNVIIKLRYSRRVMWLKISTCGSATTVAQNYLDCIRNIGGSQLVANTSRDCISIIMLCGYDHLFTGCPMILRSDLGTENVKLAYLQPFLRRHCTDSLVHCCFLYGRSTSNQVHNYTVEPLIKDPPRKGHSMLDLCRKDTA